MWFAWISLSLKADISFFRAASASADRDDLDHLVEVIERDQQALDDVVAFLGPAQVVARAARNDLDLVVDVVPTISARVSVRGTLDEGGMIARNSPAVACACRAGSALRLRWPLAS